MSLNLRRNLKWSNPHGIYTIARPRFGSSIIPESAKEKPSEGEVVSAGEGARKDNGDLIPMAVKAGDKVLFGKWSGTEVTIDGEELLIMKESDILGLL